MNATLETDLRRRLHRGALAAFALLLVVLAVVLAAGSTPRACATCHTSPEIGGRAASGPHAGVDCYTCHLAQRGWSLPGFKVRELASMYPARLTGARPGRAVVDRVGRSACLSCHAKVLAGTVERAGLRIRHSLCVRADVTCGECHSLAGHEGADGVTWRRIPVMEDCVSCHVAKGAKTACDTCHVGRGPRDRLVQAPWQVTHGASWRTMHGQGRLDSCITCHRVSYCQRCHGTGYPHGSSFGAEHGKLSLEPSAQCSTCHSNKAFCSNCHGIAMPHPAGFLPSHSKLARGIDDAVCQRCHTVRDCGSCHANHTHPGGAAGIPVPRVDPGVAK